MGVTKEVFGTAKTGSQVTKYIIKNKKGSSIEMIDLGAMLVSVWMPDKNGNMLDVVLGYDNVASYEENPCYFGAVIGRTCNRTANASVPVGDIVCKMPVNETPNNLHSGPDGFERRMWDVTEIGEDCVTFSLISQDGDQGFPGEFKISVTYTLTDENEVKIHYTGSCDQDTIANLTNHAYFNLNGHNSGSILDHTLMLNADGFNPVGDGSIPTGEILPVKGTPMDFTSEKVIGDEIDADYEQLIRTKGYDHNYVLNQQDGSVRLAAKAKSPKSGIVMETYTDTVGVQFYAGNFINGPAGKGGAEYAERDGFALETQFYPNAANVPQWPSPILKKGEIYDTTTIYRFI